MGKDIDEDLIEATIRRVQGQKNAAPDLEPSAEGHPSGEPEDPIEATVRRVRAQAVATGQRDADETPEPAGATEDEIEAQIRRVQAVVAASRSDNQISPPPADENGIDPIEATIKRVQAQAAAQAGGISEAIPAETAFEDDDPIAATIARVQAEAAARADQDAVEHPEIRDEGDAPIAPAIAREQPQTASGEAHEPGDAESVAEEDEAIAATIRRVQSQAVARQDESSAFAPAPLPPLEDEDNVVEQAIEFAERHPRHGDHERAAAERKDPLEGTSWPGRDDRLLGEPETWEVAARRLEQGMQETKQDIRALAARFDALLPALERLMSQSAGAELTVVSQTNDEDWDDAPRPSVQFGSPPRQPLLRDPAPQSAAAHQLIEEPAAAGPRLRALDEHGNLNEHLPRQYRITVEDKRRGVDLVPLHRAMQGMHNVKDMSLLSYSNGVAIVAVESVGVIDPDNLGEAVARCMSRQTKVEVHNEQTMVVKIQEE